MAQIKLDDKRVKILQAEGHILIEGGPGCGKTTIALLKAQNRIVDLGDEQRILFLSFSRAAVRQVTDRMTGVLNHADREAIEVRTFHAFFLDVLRSHGRLLTGKSIGFITPERESQRRAYYDGEWSEEVTRLAGEESVFVFDSLASFAADLVGRSADIRQLYSDRYPLIIVDEFQDTNQDQWRAIRSLSEQSVVVGLADPDQRIYDHLDGVDEHRLTEFRLALNPSVFDLSADNHRSPGGGILAFANAVLRCQPTELPENIIERRFRYLPFEAMTHSIVLDVRNELARRLGKVPAIAVLTRTNMLASQISESLASDDAVWDGKVLPAVDHELSWDPMLAAASALVIASVLEWPFKNRKSGVVDTLRQVLDYYRTKLGSGTKGARATIVTLEKAIAAIEADRTPASKTAKILLDRFQVTEQFSGQPVRDWQSARARLAGSNELDEIFRQARLLRMLKATDALAGGLLDAWDGASGYVRAVDVVRVVLAEESVNVSRHDPPAVSVMSMHKSKGKEFDAVVIVEGRHQGRFFDNDPRHHDADRRLLRVAITRARHLVVFVRPDEASPLTPSG